MDKKQENTLLVLAAGGLFAWWWLKNHSAAATVAPATASTAPAAAPVAPTPIAAAVTPASAAAATPQAAVPDNPVNDITFSILGIAPVASPVWQLSIHLAITNSGPNPIVVSNIMAAVSFSGVSIHFMPSGVAPPPSSVGNMGGLFIPGPLTIPPGKTGSSWYQTGYIQNANNNFYLSALAEQNSNAIDHESPIANEPLTIVGACMLNKTMHKIIDIYYKL